MRQLGKVSCLVVILAFSALAQTSTMDGMWIGKYTDSALAGYVSLELRVDNGSVVGSFKTDSGKEGNVTGTASVSGLKILLDQTTKSCSGLFEADLTLQDGDLRGGYSGGDCDGQKRDGHFNLSRSTRPMKATVLRSRDGTFMPIDHFYVHGCPFWTLQTDRFFLAASESTVGGYKELALFIVNRTDQPVTFDPDETTALDMVSKRFLKSYSPQEIDKKIYHNARLRAFFAAFAAGMGSAGARLSYSEGQFTASDQNGNRYSGSVSGTTTTHNPPDNRASEAAAEQVWNSAEGRAKHFDKSALLKHTILPGNDVMGSIFFSRPAKGSLKEATQLDERGELYFVEVRLGTEKFRLFFPVDTFLSVTQSNTKAIVPK